MRFYATTARTEDNEQTTVSAQKNAMFSSQRFFGLEKEFREKTLLCALKKPQWFHHSASMNKKQRMTKNNNKGEPNYFRLKDKQKIDKQTTIKMTRKDSLGHNRCEWHKSSKPNNQIETDLNSIRAIKNTNDHHCAPMEQQKELRTMNKPL